MQSQYRLESKKQQKHDIYLLCSHDNVISIKPMLIHLFSLTFRCQFQCSNKPLSSPPVHNYTMIALQNNYINQCFARRFTIIFRIISKSRKCLQLVIRFAFFFFFIRSTQSVVLQRPVALLNYRTRLEVSGRFKKNLISES